MAIIGIDLGTTNSLAAAYKDGECILIPNQFGEYLTPSVVGLSDSGELITGKIARERLISRPDVTASLFKRDMGTAKTVKFGHRSFLPEELSALVLKQLASDAEKFLGEKVEEAVISVPAYFDVSQRAATKLAGDLAGIKVDRLINEPSAAALAYHQTDEDEVFIVFDLGGGTLDVSVVECFDNVVSICAVAGDNHLGGSDFDKIIADYICDQQNISYSDLSVSEQESLLRLAEQSKIGLQEEDEVTMHSRIPRFPFELILTNELLYALSSEIFERLKRPILKAAKDSGLSIEEIDKFVLVGGSCHMKIISEYLQNLINLPVDNHSDIDRLAALGLGTYIGIRQRSEHIKNLVLTDICPLSLSIDVHNDTNPANPLASVLIRRNTVLPASASHNYCAHDKGQKSVAVNFYQGDQIYAKDNKLLGSLEVSLPINHIKNESFTVTFSYDINAILIAEIHVHSTNRTETFIYNGGMKRLDKHAVSRHADYIKSLSLMISENEQYDLLIERAKRLFAEASPYEQELIAGSVLQFEALFKETTSILKRTKLCQSFTSILDQYEAAANTYQGLFDLPSDPDDTYLS